MAKETPQYQPDMVLSLPEAPSRKASEYLDSYNSWVYAAVTYTANIFAGVEVKLYQKRILGSGKNASIEYDEVVEHESLALLQFVNPYMTQTQLMTITSIYQDLLGEAAWVLIRGTGGSILEIWPLRPDWIEIVPSRKNFIEKYIYKPGGGFKGVDLKPEDVIWFKDLSPTNPYRGYGKVRAGALAIDIDTYMSQWSRNFFFNSGIPSVVFKTEQSLSPEVASRYMEQFRTNFVGRHNSHKVALLEGGAWDVQEIGSEAREMDFLESKKYIRDEILAMFGVSKANLGVVEDVNRANQEASDARFMKNVIKPKLITYVGVLNEFLLPNYDDTSLFLNFEDPVPEDIETKLKVYENARKYTWMTINEIRREEGLEDVDGGDEIQVPNTQPSEGEDEEKPKDAKAFTTLRLKAEDIKKRRGMPKLGAPIPTKSLLDFQKEKQVDAIKEQIMPELKQLVAEMMRSAEKPEYKYFDDEKKDMFWKELIDKTDIQEERMKILVRDLASEQSKVVLDKLSSFNKHYVELKADRPENLLFDLRAENLKWAKSFTPFLAQIIKDQGDDVLGEFGVATGLNMDNKEINKYLNQYIKMMTREINGTTKSDLIKTIKDGLKKGESISQVRNRILAVYDTLTKERANLIARSEVLRANNLASLEGYKQSGVVVKKQWLTAKDERTCPFCMSMDGKVVGISANYFDKNAVLDLHDENGNPIKMDLSYSDVAAPPLHPQCRCTILPITISQDRGFDKAEVKVSTSTLATDLLKALQKREDKELSEAIEEKKKTVAELNKTVINAHQELIHMEEKANDKAHLIVQTAKQEAKKVMDASEVQAKQIMDSVVDKIDEKVDKRLNQVEEEIKEAIHE